MRDCGCLRQKSRIAVSLNTSWPRKSSSEPSSVSTTLIPASRAARAREYLAAGAVRSSGVSACQTTSGKTSAISLAPMRAAWCCVGSRPAILRWSSPSSNRGLSNVTENVRSGSGDIRAASAHVIDESSPPLRYPPMGPSARMRSAMELFMR